jgi:hypothetical protein
MKRIFIFLFLAVIGSNLIYCQLLTNPGLSLTDFETGLSNPEYIREILLGHSFRYEKFDNDNCISSECWQSEQEIENSTRPGLIIRNPVINLCMHEFKPNQGPRSGVVRSIDLQIYKTPDIAEKLNMLIEAIGDSYPDKEISILDNSNQSMVYRKIGSAIEVEFIKSQTEFSDYDWYFLVFYLYESPHF